MITAKEAKQMTDKRNSTWNQQDECELNKIEKNIREAIEDGRYATTYLLGSIRVNGANEYLIIKKLQENGYKVKLKKGVVDGWNALNYLRIDWKKN